MLQIVAYCTESVVYMFLFPNRKQIKKLQKSILLQFKLGWGHLSSWRPLSREMLLEFDSWQFQKSLKKSKEFHRRTKHFINSHTQKLISNPLDFTFSIFKKMQPWKSNCRKNTLKTLWPMKLEKSTWKQIGQVNLQTVINIASGMKPLEHKFLRNLHFHVWEFHFRKIHFRVNSPKRNVTSAVLKNRNQNLKSNICRTRHVTSRRWILPSAEMHNTKISLHFTMFLSAWKPKKCHLQRTKNKATYHWIA